MRIGKPKDVSTIYDQDTDESFITSFIDDLKLQITIQLKARNVKAESRVLEKILKESLDELPPTTLFHVS